jgi:DNA primase
LTPEVVFCFDGDKAGRSAAWRALEQAMPLMMDGRQARFLFLPEGEDPDTQVRKVGSSSFNEKISQATSLAEFFFDSLSAQVDMNTLEGRARLGSLAMPLVKQLPQGIFRQLILDQLSRITGTDVRILLTTDNHPQPGEIPPRASTASPPLKHAWRQSPAAPGRSHPSAQHPPQPA